MKIGVIGLGYVGLPSAVGFAELGFHVIGTDSNLTHLKKLKDGHSPLYEPGLQTLLTKHLESGLLEFKESIADVVNDTYIIFICVGTPQYNSGQTDLSYVKQAVTSIAKNLREYRIIVEKSTVPVNTADWIRETINNYSNSKIDFDVASNPEFLRESSAIDDFLNPDRIVLGVESEKAEKSLTELYNSFNCPIFITDLKTVEIIKHASNSFLAMRISFINMIADLCEVTGADVTKVSEGMGLDPRIGQDYLEAGIGYGGYCLPKDIRAFIHIGEELGVNFSLLNQVEYINNERLDRLIGKLKNQLGEIKNKQIGILGLSFKPGTDDIRMSPGINIVKKLNNMGAILKLHDPKAMENTRNELKNLTDLTFCESAYDVSINSDSLIVLTGWSEYKNLDLNRLGSRMAKRIMIDGRNLFEPNKVRDSGFIYHSVGRS